MDKEIMEAIEECERVLEKCLVTLELGQEIMSAMRPIALVLDSDGEPNLLKAIDAYILAVDGVREE